MDRKRRTTVQSLERGLEVLVAVAQADRPLGITELGQRFGLAKGSVSRVVATLVAHDFLVRDPVTAKYRPSTRLWELAHGSAARLDIRDVARPVMEKLHAATGETVHLTVPNDSGEMMFLDKLDSTRPVRPNVEVGALLPAYCVANGKAVLAHLPDSRVERILAGKLRRYTDATITRKRELLAQLGDVRRRGYAVNRGEYRPEVWGVAAPVRDHTGTAVAALGISVPQQRMTEALIQDLGHRLARCAREVSAALGYRAASAEQAVVTPRRASSRLGDGRASRALVRA